MGLRPDVGQCNNRYALGRDEFGMLSGPKKARRTTMKKKKWKKRKGSKHMNESNRTLIYDDTDTQSANLRGNSLRQTTERHLNNS